MPVSRTSDPPENLKASFSVESDPKLVELLSNFLISQGIPLEVTKDAKLQELITYINPKSVIPSDNVMMEYVKRQNSINKSLINYPKTIGPIGVTIDVHDDLTEKFLVFSIHYFENIDERKNVVFLKKMSNNQINAAHIIETIRREVNVHSHYDVKFRHSVSSNMEILQMIALNEHVEQHHICFYHNMSIFVTELLKIEAFSMGLNVLREFIRFFEPESDLYCKFQRFQSSRNQERDLPSMDNNSWESSYIFLTKCLVLHKSFETFCEVYGIDFYIYNKSFKDLIHLQRLLRQCVYYCRSMSTPSSCISQIIPAIEGLRRLIDREFPFQQFQREKIQNLLKFSFESYNMRSHEMAVLLDPRFSYTEIFTEEKWKDLENLVMEDFVNNNWRWAINSGIQDTTLMNPRGRMNIISLEITIYRQFLMRERPEESDCPSRWWAERQSPFKLLSAMARELLSCPAVSADASHYFSDGGKLRRLTKTCSGTKLEQSLNLAGSLQNFRGKGASESSDSEDGITEDMMRILDRTAEQTSENLTPKDISVKKELPEIDDFQEVTWQEPSSSIVKLEPLDPPDESQFDMFTVPAIQELEHPEQVIHPQSARGCPLRCHICKEMKRPGDYLNIRRECDRLSILAGCLYRELISFQHAERISNFRCIVVCNSHIPEIIEEIYGRIGLTSRKDLYDCSLDRLEDMLINVRRLAPEMTAGALRTALVLFLTKFDQCREIEIEEHRSPPIQSQAKHSDSRRRPDTDWIPNSDQILNITCQKMEQSNLPEDSPQNPSSTAPKSINPRSRNKRCIICSQIKSLGEFRDIRKANERLLILIGCLYRKSISMERAETIMKNRLIAVCITHIQETLDEIYTRLCITDVRYLNSCSIDRIQNMLVTVAVLKPDMTAVSLRDALFEFLDRFDYVRNDMNYGKLTIGGPPEASTSFTEYTKRRADAEEDFVMKKNPRKSAN
ncbi:hypothetical protein GCK72_007388 [Caenorhabditis remanei]|uniref:Uncharacterized protein n=1 Tax=Caenorhabditis remanei TaxID=31234 RepID=A0A6A5HJ09_CAERE|nr:hypothetical protein GCK72_007388 [Caenorhabditis remanei]KAF1767429.1 hypothetical protein GCK72_007388 [Caenorhabditis remanei]